MIAARSASTELQFLHTLDEEHLDLLPFGVIALDHSATIVRYNLAEARFARLDRHGILGKNFFRDIAPCTRTPEFQGRFERFITRPDALPERFGYVFDFRFGAQDVEVELVHAPEQIVYVTINRKKFLPPRKDVPDAILGIEQRALAPNEGNEGVARDPSARRQVQPSLVFFEALFASLRRRPDAQAFVDDWGASWGRLSAIDLETESIETFEKLLRELPMVTLGDLIAGATRRQGWGQLAFDFSHAKQGAFAATLKRSALAFAGGHDAGPRCALFAGFLRGILGQVAARRLYVREVKCAAAGGVDCEFVIVSEARARALDRALAEGGSTRDIIVATWRS